MECESALFCDGYYYGRAACEHLAAGQRAISPVSDVFISELIEFIVSQFWGGPIVYWTVMFYQKGCTARCFDHQVAILTH